MRTTPTLLGLFSLVTLFAHQQVKAGQLPMRQTAWYIKPSPTFSDALALVRRERWCQMGLSSSLGRPKVEKIAGGLFNPLADTLFYAGL